MLAYTPDGRRVITGGSNSAIRIYTVDQDGEPKTVDGSIDGHFAIGATVGPITKTSIRGICC